MVIIILLCDTDINIIVDSRAEEPGNYIAVQRLTFSFEAAPAPRGQKHAAPALNFWLSLAKYFFPHKLIM